MTSIRRSASLSLALSLLLVSGAASAAPVTAKRESAIVSLGKSIKLGVQDYKQRRAAAGPGFIKRGMIHSGAALRATGKAIGTMAINLKESITSGGKQAVSATRRTVIAGAVATAIYAKSAPAVAKASIMRRVDRSKEGLKAGMNAVGEAAYNVADRTVAGTMNTIDRSIAAVGAVKNKAVGAVQAKLAARAERRAAQQDFKAWLNESGNESLKTFHTGATKEARVGTAKLARAGMAAATVANAAFAATGSTMNMVAMPMGAYATAQANSMVKSRSVVAASRTLEYAINASNVKLDSERVARWTKAGVLVDPTAP